MHYFRNLTFVTILAILLAACGGQSEVAEESASNTVENTDDNTVEEVATICDRDCIIGITDTYIAAVVAHDPSAAPLADNIVFVENIKKMSPGEGLWQSVVSGPDSFAIYVPDEVNQSVGYLGMMRYMSVPPSPSGITPEERAEWANTTEKAEQPVLVALRLKLEDGKITEAEHLLAGIRETANTDPNSPFAGRPAPIERLKTPRPGLLAEVPEGSRMEHAKLIEIGASYYDALDDNDGSLMPFAEDCQRHENGMVTAGADAGAGPNNAGTGTIARDCIGQLNSKVMSYITIENRRMFAADPVTGLSMGFSHFTHPMDNMPYEVINTDGSTRDYEMSFSPFDLPAAHVYKIGADGLVHEIEAMGFWAPYNSPTGWE